MSRGGKVPPLWSPGVGREEDSCPEEVRGGTQGGAGRRMLTLRRCGGCWHL